MIPAWLLGFVPVIGSMFFISGMVVVSPVVAACQYLGFTWLSFDREQLSFRDHEVEIAKGKKRQIIKRADIIEIRERFEPPCIVASIVCADEVTMDLNPLVDTDELIDWAQRSGIAVRKLQNNRMESNG